MHDLCLDLGESGGYGCQSFCRDTRPSVRGRVGVQRSMFLGLGLGIEENVTKNEPCEVINDWFGRFYELVVYDDARGKINHTYSRQLLSILRDTL